MNKLLQAYTCRLDHIRSQDVPALPDVSRRHSGNVRGDAGAAWVIRVIRLRRPEPEQRTIHAPGVGTGQGNGSDRRAWAAPGACQLVRVLVGVRRR